MSKPIYTIKEGDSLSIIARDELGDINRWTELAFLNSLQSPFRIYPGQVIWLPDDSVLPAGQYDTVVTTGKFDAPKPIKQTTQPQPENSLIPAAVVIIAAIVLAKYFD